MKAAPLLTATPTMPLLTLMLGFQNGSWDLGFQTAVGGLNFEF